MESEIVWQCQYCRLPRHPEGARISHGAHDICILVEEGRDIYLKIVEMREKDTEWPKIKK